MNAHTRQQSFKAPAEFYTASVFSDLTGWEHMTVNMMDRAEAVQLVSDYMTGFASWQIVRVDLATGTAQDVTDAILTEAADDSDDYSSYLAQRYEAIIAGAFA